MSAVFVSHAIKDRDIATAVIHAMQREGLTVSSAENISRGVKWKEEIKKQIDTASCVVVLWSASAEASEWVQNEIELAMRAWSHDKLLLVTLDDTPLPVGLRDLSTVPLTRARRKAAIEKLVESVKEIQTRESGKAAQEVAQRPRASAARPRRYLILSAIGLLAAIGLLLLLPYRFELLKSARGPQPTQPTQPEASDVTALASEWITLALVLAILFLVAALGAALVWWRSTRSKSQLGQPPGRASKSESAPQLPVFLSYSRRDSKAVDALVNTIEQAGYGVWIDRRATGGRFADRIVRAIRASKVVALVGSKNAYATDHVIREVYVAGEFNKPFLVVLLDDAKFPDGIVYFVTGFPRLPVDTADQERLKAEISGLIA